MQRASAAVQTPEQHTRHFQELRGEDTETPRIEGLLAEQVVEHVSVIGYGDGGLLALELAARGQIAVDSMFLVDTMVLPPPADVSLEHVLDMLEDKGVDVAGGAEIVRRALRTKDPHDFAESAMAHFGPSSLTADDDALVREMLHDNAMAAFLTAPPGCREVWAPTSWPG